MLFPAEINLQTTQLHLTNLHLLMITPQLYQISTNWCANGTDGLNGYELWQALEVQEGWMWQY